MGECECGESVQSQRISFHDSGILSVRREGGSIVLDLENVTFEDGMRNATIRLVGVLTITCDGKLVDDLLPVYEDGEILTFEHTTNAAHLIVDWTDFTTHQNRTHSYRITRDSIRVEAY